MDIRIKELLGTGDRIVDLGCGSGHFLDDLGDRFNEKIGLDVSRRRLDEKERGGVEGWIFCETDLNSSFPVETETVDAVIANQVIEHIVDPVNFAGEIYRTLKPGGRCVITTPNIRYLKHIAHLLLSGYGPRTAGGNILDGQWDDGHIHYFTHKDLRELLSASGFTQVNSCALINNPEGNMIRRLLNITSASFPVREFLSGNIMIWAIK